MSSKPEGAPSGERKRSSFLADLVEGSVSQLPLSGVAWRLAVVLGFHLAWHLFFEYGPSVFGILNDMHSAHPATGKAPFPLMETIVPALLLGALVARRRTVLVPLRWPASFLLWPVFIVLLDLVHLSFDHRGLLWWPTLAGEPQLGRVVFNYIFALAATVGGMAFTLGIGKKSKGQTRLAADWPELETGFEKASDERRRSAMLLAVGMALGEAPVDRPLVAEARAHLVEGRGLASEKLRGLGSLRDELDERYFDLKDAAERGEGDQADWMAVFSQARAVSALCFALGPNPDDAIYEALHAMESLQDAVDRVRAELEG